MKINQLNDEMEGTKEHNGKKEQMNQWENEWERTRVTKTDEKQNKKTTDRNKWLTKGKWMKSKQKKLTKINKIMPGRTEKHKDEMHNKTKIEQKNKQKQTKPKTEWKNIRHGRQTKYSLKQKYGV